ncbi:MAG TPA: HAD family phosphatase [Candidatus Angelobacter sp.]|nr:HAD family phosphatase [Candidatus Angelobacter sp.]
MRGLLVDWGGVLTGDMRVAVEAWARAVAVPLDAYVGIMRDWMGEPYGTEALLNPVHALERGEMTVPDFEVRLADALTERTGVVLRADGLLARMFETFEHAPDMSGLVRRARAAGLRTGLLSNSWGNDYPRDGWDDLFDVVVISGEVGMRKPEARIFEHALDLLGLDPEECVFVDDLPHNVAAAEALGMVGVRHRSYAETLVELEALFGIALS